MKAGWMGWSRSRTPVTWVCMSMRPGMTQESLRSMTASPGTKPSLMAVILPSCMRMDWLVVAGLPGSAMRWPAWMTVVFASGGGAGVWAAVTSAAKKIAAKADKIFITSPGKGVQYIWLSFVAPKDFLAAYCFVSTETRIRFQKFQRAERAGRFVLGL